MNNTTDLSGVEWRDLVALRPFEVMWELTLSLPWLVFSLYLAAQHFTILALLCSFMFFLTGLRQVHNAFHQSLGVSRIVTRVVKFLLSMLMLGSMQAVEINHLRHHRFTLEDEDVEAMAAKLSWWKALLIGPIFPLLLHRKALAVATRDERRVIKIELACNLSILLLVFLVLEIRWLQYHYAVMVLAQCLTAFFAVWTVHHGSNDHKHVHRTVRNRLKATLTYNMFYHLEHHLFPAVPTCKLPILSQRIDDLSPSKAKPLVF